MKENLEENKKSKFELNKLILYIYSNSFYLFVFIGQEILEYIKI